MLSKVVDEVRQNSPNGGFVKQDENGNWHEVGDFLAREKTSQSFRDALHDRYKSSNLSKKKRRQDEQSKIASGSISSLPPRSEFEISSRLERISKELLVERKCFKFSYCEINVSICKDIIFSFLPLFHREITRYG